MFHRIVEGFFERQKEVVPDFRCQWPRWELHWDVKPAFDMSSRQKILSELAEIGGEAVQCVMLGVYSPDDFVHRAGEFAGGFVNAIEIGGSFGMVEFRAGRLAKHADARQ